MEFEISLNNLKFYSYHGVLEEERCNGNEFIVNLSIFVSCNSSIEKDELQDTISYADLFEIVKSQMSISRNLLEKVAYSIATTIKTDYPQVKKGKISIEKVHPPIPSMFGSASVTLFF